MVHFILISSVYAILPLMLKKLTFYPDSNYVCIQYCFPMNNLLIKYVVDKLLYFTVHFNTTKITTKLFAIYSFSCRVLYL